MLPSRPSTKDFYACGARVQIPSIKVSTRTSVRHKSVSTASSLAPLASENSGSRRRHTVGGERESLRSHVGHLKQTLTFSDDVVSSRSPQAVSYSHARGRLAHVFRTSPVTDTRRGGGRLSRDVGRHNCRGEARQHPLCHLRCITVPHTERSREARLTTHRSQSLQPLVRHGDVASYPSGMLYRGVRVVPVSSSVQWEDRVLEKVTSSTAARLGARRKARGREEEEEVSEAVMERGKMKFDDKVEMECRECRAQDYVRSLEEGAKPVFGRVGERDRAGVIVLDNDTAFTKVLQSRYPQPPSEWCDEGSAEDVSVVKGAQRWTDFPRPAPTPQRLQWVNGQDPSTDSLSEEVKQSSSLASAGNSVQWRYHDIMREWSSRHSLHIQPEDMCEAAIIKHTQSHIDSVKLRGISACSLLAEQRARQRVTQRGSCHRVSWEGGGREGGEEEMVKELEKLVDDVSPSVHISAAVALYCLGRGSKMALDALLGAVQSRRCDSTDEWAGLQCLVECGVCDECVVLGLQRFLLNSSDSSCREQAGQLMAELSDRTSLVHALLAEQLTSRGWQERLSACNILPTLLCPLSTDVCSRLVVMSWEDWSSSVRDAASRALGKTGHGKLLHDELVRRLGCDREVVRLDALRKVNYLELMTPQLLSAFLPSLSDQHASIKTEAIAVCGRLGIRDGAVIQQLIHLLGDSVWIIRAHALRALASIGCCDEDVMEQLLWTVRCDKVPAVRAEACHTLCTLWKMKEEGREEGGAARLISTLQERLVVEDDDVVSRELMSALHLLGGSVDRSDPLVDFIRSEVQRLGTSRAITQGVLRNDQTALTDYIIARPLALPTTRDYLSQQCRRRFYSHEATTTNAGMKGAESTVPERVWSPDKETIDGHLAVIERMCVPEQQ